MTSEFRQPTPEEIVELILKSGRTLEQFVAMQEVLSERIESGNLRADLNCWENKIRFFDMAQRMYVRNEGMKMKDAEIGIHLRQCSSPPCVRMQKAYFEVLRPSQDEDSAQAAAALVGLEMELMMGKERPDLKGKPSMYYDSDTGRTLRIAKAVDITDKCRLEQEWEAVLVYIKPVKGTMVDIQENGPKGGGSSVAYRLNSGMFTPEDPVFRMKADSMRIDPQFLHAIIVANAPITPQRKGK